MTSSLPPAVSHDRPPDGSAAHTPGPWRVTDEINRFSGGEVIRPSRGDGVDSPVAFVCDFNRFDRDDERKANARLIAAAPDLLAALKRLTAAAAEWDWDVNADTGSDPDLDVARAAIAKAEGRQP